MKLTIAAAALSVTLLFTACKKETITDDQGAGTTTPTTPVPSQPSTPDEVYADNDHMLLGNPSKAKAITDSANNYLMRRTYYALSYNSSRGIPNWVSWHLWGNDIGGTNRQDDFRADNTLPGTFYWVQANSYSGSGFDRGHNCPSADRTSSTDANSATFLMSNMIPQAPNNNQQTWNNMEDYVRTLATASGMEAYIIMGSYGTGGSGSNGFMTTINNGNVTVPSYIWKVAVLMHNGSNDTTRVDSATRVIAVITPNVNTVNSNWKTYRTSVDAIEAATGYDLLSRVPANIQNYLEAKIDNQ
jgi:endonuclease G, mitochondrial